MSILLNRDSRLIIQGITGSQGSYHAKVMQEYGSNLVAGVTPGKGGTSVHGVPVFETVQEAVAYCGVDGSMVLVPPSYCLDAVAEALENGIKLVVVITEHVPVHDSMKMRAMAKAHNAYLIGPNTIGIITPGQSKLGIMPGFLYGAGRLGMISRSGTLSHETASNLYLRGIGFSTCVGIGGDPIIGSDFTDFLRLFKDDADTDGVIIIGEIGGNREEAAAEYLRRVGYPKPVFAYIAGKTAPPGKKMGHAGAIIQGGAGTATAKGEVLAGAGVRVAGSLEELVVMVEQWWEATH
ncbi:hypothetical protein SY88_12385 [Clostridiales bacterium PH28_bin88]|nr:hypothetical protein SY88_12385 [Clostridiales bacterium PH28_bin88]